MEKRRGRRFRIDRCVLVTGPDGEILRAATTDLSSWGMGILSPRPYDPGDELRLRFQLSVNGDAQDVALAAQVKHRRLSRDLHALGLEFTEVEAGAREIISAFLRFRERLWRTTTYL